MQKIQEGQRKLELARNEKEKIEAQKRLKAEQKRINRQRAIERKQLDAQRKAAQREKQEAMQRERKLMKIKKKEEERLKKLEEMKRQAQVAATEKEKIDAQKKLKLEQQRINKERELERKQIQATALANARAKQNDLKRQQQLRNEAKRLKNLNNKKNNLIRKGEENSKIQEINNLENNRVNKFANQKTLSKYLQNIGMNRANRKTFMARLKTNRLNIIKANAKKFMNNKKKPNVKPEPVNNKKPNNNVKPVNEKKPNVKPVNEKKPNVKPVNEKKPNVKPVNEKKPNIKPVNNKKPNNNAPNVKPVNEKKPNVKPQEPKVNKFANQKTLSKYLQNLGMKRGNRKTFMARLGKNKLENIQSNAKKFMNDKKKPNVKPQEPKVNKFANQKTLSKYLQNLGMNRGNRKTFMARLGKNKLENIQSNANKFMNDKKKHNVKVNKFANQKTLSKYLQNLGMNRGNRKTFMARLGKNKLENIQSSSKKFMNDKKKPNVKVNKFVNQKTLSKYLQNLGMNRGNRKTFMARLGKNKLENIQSNAKKFMNDKKKPNVKPQEPKVNKFANQKSLSKYLQNLGMKRGNRKTFMARLGKNKLENIQSNAKKFMNDKKKPNVKPQEPKVNKFANQKVLSKYLQNVGMNRGNRKTFMARLKSEKLNAIKANVKKFMNAKKEPKVNKFANQKTLSKYLQNVGMNRGNRKTFMARLKSEKLNAIKANAKKFMNKPKELSNTDKGVRWKLFNSPKYNKLTTKEREDLFKRWMNKKNKTIWANAQKLQASRTKSIVPVKTNAPKAKPVTATNMKKEFQNLMKSKGVSADSAFKRLSLKYHPNKGGKQENFIRLQSIRDELKTTKNTGRQSLLNRINKNVPRETNFSQGRMKWKSAIKAAKNSELAKIKQLLDNKLKLKKNVESTVKNVGKKKQLLHQLMSYKNDTATRRKQMLALPAPKPVNKFANQKALSKHLQNLKMNRSDRTKFVARLKTQKLNVIKANAKKFMNAKARASAKAKANAK